MSHFVDLRTHKNETAAKGQQPADRVSTFFKILLPGLRSNNDPHYPKELVELRNNWIDVRELNKHYFRFMLKIIVAAILCKTTAKFL